MTVNTHHTKLKGDIGVAAVIFDLTKKGYLISEPMSENAPYDLICDTGEKLLRIQVKVRSDGKIPYRTHWSDKNGNHTNIIDVSKIDYFALVNEDYTKICYPPSIMAGKSICFETPNSSVPYNDYKDYLSFEAIQSKRQNTQVVRDIVKTKSTKIIWPTVEEMAILVLQKPTSQLALDLGVSDVAIGKFCKKHNIAKPPRGHWTKIPC